MTQQVAFKLKPQSRGFHLIVIYRVYKPSIL